MRLTLRLLVVVALAGAGLLVPVSAVMGEGACVDGSYLGVPVDHLEAGYGATCSADSTSAGR